MLRSKGEELFVLIDSYENEFRKNVGQISIDLSQAGEMNAGGQINFSSGNSTLQRIEMLTSVYFDHAVPAFRKLKEHSTLLGPLIESALDCTLKVEKQKVAVKFLFLSAGMSERSQTLQKEVIHMLTELHADVIITKESAAPTLIEQD